MRGVPRWVAVLAVVATGAVVCAFTVRRALAPATCALQLSQTAIPADGFTSTELRISPSNGRQLRDLQVTVEDPHRAAVESVTVEGDTATASLRAGVLPGETKLRIAAPGVRDAGDHAAHHARRQRHDWRRHSGLLALARSCRPRRLPPLVYLPGRGAVLPRAEPCPPRLTIAPRSCASPIAKPCARTMQHGHTLWRCRPRLRPATSSNINIPTLRLAAALFRVRGGSFQASDLRDGAFAQFADVETLWRHNTLFRRS